MEARKKVTLSALSLEGRRDVDLTRIRIVELHELCKLAKVTAKTIDTSDLQSNYNVPATQSTQLIEGEAAKVELNMHTCRCDSCKKSQFYRFQRPRERSEWVTAGSVCNIKAGSVSFALSS